MAECKFIINCDRPEYNSKYKYFVFSIYTNQNNSIKSSNIMGCKKELNVVNGTFYIWKLQIKKIFIINLNYRTFILLYR